MWQELASAFSQSSVLQTTIMSAPLSSSETPISGVFLFWGVFGHLLLLVLLLLLLLNEDLTQ